MKKVEKIFILIFSTLIIPAISFADSLVPCNTAEECKFPALLQLVNKVINYLLLLTVPVAAVMFAYAGFILVTAGGESSGAKTKAKSIITDTVFGLIIAFAAWLIVKLILTTLGFQTTLF